MASFVDLIPICEPFEQRPTALGMAHLAPAEHDRDLDLVALAQEAYDMALLGGVVVGIDLRAELDLLDRDRALVLARQLLLLLLVVAVLAVVHHPADGRIRVRRDLDEIEVLRPRILQGLVARLDADLRSVVVDQPHLRYADRLVDTGARLCRPHILATARPHWRFTECFNLLLSCAGPHPACTHIDLHDPTRQT